MQVNIIMMNSSGEKAEKHLLCGWNRNFKGIHVYWDFLLLLRIGTDHNAKNLSFKMLFILWLKFIWSWNKVNIRLHRLRPRIKTLINNHINSLLNLFLPTFSFRKKNSRQFWPQGTKPRAPWWEKQVRMVFCSLRDTWNSQSIVNIIDLHLVYTNWWRSKWNVRNSLLK